jgi:hypothetical protein
VRDWILRSDLLLATPQFHLCRYMSGGGMLSIGFFDVL